MTDCDAVEFTVLSSIDDVATVGVGMVAFSDS